MSDLIQKTQATETHNKSKSAWTAEFYARQIVDDAWRNGFDIRKQQHAIQALLEGSLRVGLVEEQNEST